MTTQQYQNLTPREATPSATSRLFSFTRIRSNNTTRFYPGDGAKLHFANRDVDTLEIPGVPSGFLAAGDVVKAYYRGTCVFKGDVATIVEARNRGTDATQTVTCVGPWSKMQRLVYRQEWFTGSGYSYSSRLILNQTRSGAAQNLNSELYEIANHGHTPCGYSVAIGDIAVSTQILPFDECRDITVADAIKRELRFFPKAVAFFDYSGQTPALKIKKNSSPSTASYVANIPKNLREYVYNAHPITGVDLEIEATGTIEGVEYHQISHQIAGDTTAGNTDCLYATLQIKGASSSTTRQSFKSVTEDIPSSLDDAEWWKERHPRLANVAANAITITDGERTSSKPSCVRISAATAGELEDAGLQCEVSKFTCKATITTTDDKEENVYLTLNYLTTNATGTAEHPKTYTWVTDSSAESGETVPSGLAATILAERSGALLSERLSIRLGDTLPTLGDAIVETEGTVFLQSFDVDCGNLTADLNFGVPEYLSPEDMASLLSGFRNKCTTSCSSMRSSGKTGSDGSTVKMGAIPPLSSSEFAPGTKAKTTIASSSSNDESSNGESSSGSVVIDTTDELPKLVLDSGDGKKITLDLSDIPETSECASQQYKIHELKYYDKDESGNKREHSHHVLSCSDIDLTKIIADGKTIEDVDVTPGDAEVVVTFTYSDSSTTEIHIPSGIQGIPGAPGQNGEDGEAPEITAIRNGSVVTILADGAAIATLKDGKTPVITASKSGKITTIFADGQPIATISDGEDGENASGSGTGSGSGGGLTWTQQNVVTGVSFSVSGGKLQAFVSKAAIWVPNSSGMDPVGSSQIVDVCMVSDLDVVTSESYSTSTHQFTNTRKRISVIGSPTDAVGETPFTATPLSSES